MLNPSRNNIDKEESDSTHIVCDKKAATHSKTSDSVQNESYGGWFGEFKSLAKSTKDSIFPAIDGIASMIHRSAMTVAAEIAQLERDAELEAERWREENYGADSQGNTGDTLPLPWEVKPRDPTGELLGSAVPTYVEDENFKHAILALSTSEETFLDPYGAGEAEDFALNEQRINLIRRLLALDANLAANHAKLSGRSDVKEALFWKNYFFHCDRLRMEYDDLIDIDVSSQCSSTLGSLVPAGDCDEGYQPSDNSYVCVRHGIASPPSSLNTLTDTLSVGDLVVIGADGCDFNDLDYGRLS